MKVIQIVPELSPFTGQSRQALLLEQFILNLNNTHAFTILPWYDTLKINDDKVKAHTHFRESAVFETFLPATDSIVYLIKPLNGFFSREELKNDNETLLLFNKSVVEFIQSLDQSFIIQCHSALSAILPLLRKNNPVTEHYPVLLTLHDLSEDFVIFKESIYKYMPNEFHKNEIEINGADSALKIGLLFSNMINLCSKNYAIEVQKEESEYRQFFQNRADKLYGIMNGIRYGIWNPAIDTFIPCKYSSDNLFGRFYNKVILQEKLNLADREEIPILFFGTRLSNEKGFDLILDSLNELKEMPVQLLIYGTGEDYPEPETEKLLNSLENVRYIRDYDEEFIHLILAGSDFILLPTRSEPDGVSFLYALKYGIIPIAYHTGGLADAVFDQTCPDSSKVNGFLFSSYDSNSFISIINEALDVWQDKTLFDKYIKNAMNADWSWKTCIRQYEVLYEKLKQSNNHNQ
ncbi:MAG: glycosyltransferase [Candidatus Cloacimonetes bacterium]|nr:glycosyltransferase [Candidatus Cloacimonadota bacterium]